MYIYARSGLAVGKAEVTLARRMRRRPRQQVRVRVSPRYLCMYVGK